jgi:hypothetical protein
MSTWSALSHFPEYVNVFLMVCICFIELFPPFVSERDDDNMVGLFNLIIRMIQIFAIHGI